MGCAAAVAALDLYADPDRFRAGVNSGPLVLSSLMTVEPCRGCPGPLCRL